MRSRDIDYECLKYHRQTCKCVILWSFKDNIIAFFAYKRHIILYKDLRSIHSRIDYGQCILASL